MALNSPNTLYERDTFLDHIARWLQVTDFASLDAVEQAFIQDAFELALDRVAAEFEWADLRAEFEVVSGIAPEQDPPLPLITGTCTVAPGGVSVTDLTADFANDGVVERCAVLLNLEKVYRVLTAVAAATTFDLTQRFVGPSSATQGYTIGKDIYPLPEDMGWLVSVMDMSDARVIPVLSEDDFLHKTEGRSIFGRPRVAMLALQHVLDDPAINTQRRELRLWPIPDSVRSYRVRYIRLPEYPAGGATRIEFGNSLQAMLIHAILVDVHARRAGTGGSEEVGVQTRFHEAKYQQMVKLFSKRDVNRTQQQDFKMGRQFVPGRRMTGIPRAVGRETIEE